MMTFAARLAKLPRCWRPGMLAIPGIGSVYRGWCRILSVDSDGNVSAWTDEDGIILTAKDVGFLDFAAALVPDLTDPATVGAIAAWCREVCGNPCLYATCTPGEDSGDVDRWHIRELHRYGSITASFGKYPTEVDAWAALLFMKLEPK